MRNTIKPNPVLVREPLVIKALTSKMIIVNLISLMPITILMGGVNASIDLDPAITAQLNSPVATVIGVMIVLGFAFCTFSWMSNKNDDVILNTKSITRIIINSMYLLFLAWATICLFNILF